MDRYAVIGNPVDHSLSPVIHAAFAEATGQDLRYDRLPAPLDGFDAAVEAFFAAGGAGLNVTVPFKSQAARWVDELDPPAALAGAVNTIVRSGAGGQVFRGHNTDGPGLVRDIVVNLDEPLDGAGVLLLGAGGAGRGVAGPLLDAGCRRLVIANRTPHRADELAAVLAGQRGGSAVEAAAIEDLAGAFDVVINATSASLSGAFDLPLAADVVADAFCYDLMYGRDHATAFCRWASAAGARRSVDGLGMLVEQAALAFELWRGVLPETAPVLELLRRGGV